MEINLDRFMNLTQVQQTSALTQSKSHRNASNSSENPLHGDPRVTRYPADVSVMVLIKAR